MRGAIVGILKLLFLGVEKGDISIETTNLQKEETALITFCYS